MASRPCQGSVGAGRGIGFQPVISSPESTESLKLDRLVAYPPKNHTPLAQQGFQFGGGRDGELTSAALANVDAAGGVARRAVGKQGTNCGREFRVGFLGGATGEHLVGREATVNRLQQRTGVGGIGPFGECDFDGRAEVEIERDQGLGRSRGHPRHDRRQERQRLDAFLFEIDATGQSAQANERGGRDAVARRGRPVVTVFIAGDEFLV